MPWSTPELQASIKKKNQRLLDFHFTHNQSLKKKANENQNKITIMKRKLKKDFTVNSLEEAGNDPAKFWQLYNLLIGNYQPPEEVEPESMNQEKANEYNDISFVK